MFHGCWLRKLGRRLEVGSDGCECLIVGLVCRRFCTIPAMLVQAAQAPMFSTACGKHGSPVALRRFRFLAISSGKIETHQEIPLKTTDATGTVFLFDVDNTLIDND